MRHEISTWPVAAQSNTWQADSGREPSAMPTPVSSSLIVTSPLWLQSPAQSPASGSRRRPPGRRLGRHGCGIDDVQHAVGDADVHRVAGVDGAVDRLHVADAQQRAAFWSRKTCSIIEGAVDMQRYDTR
jgi:hypothetical protein